MKRVHPWHGHHSSWSHLWRSVTWQCSTRPERIVSAARRRISRRHVDSALARHKWGLHDTAGGLGGLNMVGWTWLHVPSCGTWTYSLTKRPSHVVILKGWNRSAAMLTCSGCIGVVVSGPSNLDLKAHYDLSNDMFKLFLSKDMTYSSGV